MIVIGGSSLHKGDNTWEAARAIACLPALTGSFGVPGGGIGPRHGGLGHGAGFADLFAPARRLPGTYAPNQMEAIVETLEAAAVKVLFLIGSNILSSFPDTNRMRAALAQTELVVAYDVFANQTIRESADIVLPGTIWLEEIGGKATNNHVHLCERVLPAAEEARPAYEIYKSLAKRLGVDEVYRWPEQEAAMDAVLDHPSAGQATADGDAIELSNARGSFTARAKVTPRMPSETVWVRDGWPDLNALRETAAVLPHAALDAFAFSVVQSRFDARVEVLPAGRSAWRAGNACAPAGMAVRVCGCAGG